MDYCSDRQEQARKAYGNPSLSVEVHGLKMESFNVEIRKNGAMKNRAFILASLSGLCSAAIVTACTLGAPQLVQSLFSRPQNSVKIMLYTITSGAGLAYVITNCFTHERSIYDLELRRELWEIENHLAGELQEMISIYKNQGLSDEEALIVTKIFSKQKNLFANLMMVEELGYSRLEPPTTEEAFSNAGAPAIGGYVLGFMIPLLPLIGNVGQVADGYSHKKASLFSGIVLLGGTLITSAAQTEVFYGAYAQSKVLMKTCVSNLLAVGTAFGFSYLASKYT